MNCDIFEFKNFCSGTVKIQNYIPGMIEFMNLRDLRVFEFFKF